MKLSSLFRRTRPTDTLNADVIRVTDNLGRGIAISKTEWRTKVLPQTLRDHWNDPDQLYAVLFDALNNGWHSDVLAAAKHLAAIDTVGSRGICIYAVALMENGQAAESETVLHDYLQKAGPNGYALTALSKAYRAQGKTGAADEALLRGLQIDPNQQGGLALYASTLQHNGGSEAEIEGLRRLTSVPGSWRPQLHLARLALEKGRVDSAMNLYDESLSNAGVHVPADLLLQISGALGLKGFFSELIERVQPLFDAKTHGVQVGNNLIKAHLEAGNVKAAREVLRALRSCQRRDWEQSIDYWEREISKAE